MCTAKINQITICITYHNEGYLLKRSLNSVREATLGLSNYKILIVDDHSSIPAKDLVADDLDVGDIEIVTNKNNMGVSSSRNLAINWATSKYITFLDADDFYCHGFKFQDVMDDLRKLECADYQVVILRSLISYPSKGLVNSYFGPTINLLANPRDIVLEYITKVKGKSVVTHVWDKLFNVEFLKKRHLKFDETMALYEDTKFSIDVLFKSEAVALIARDMTTHTSTKTNEHYFTRTLNFLKLSDDLKPIFAYFSVNQTDFNAAHLAKTYMALSSHPWADATKGMRNIAESNLIRKDTVNFYAIQSLFLRFLTLVGAWRSPLVMVLALKWYSRYLQIFRALLSICDFRKGKKIV